MVKPTKQFLQVTEDQDEEDIENGIPFENIRLEIKNDAEALALMDEIRPKFKKVKYTANIHKCFHPGGTCVLDPVEKVVKKGGKPIKYKE